jgi:hypothetical protein
MKSVFHVRPSRDQRIIPMDGKASVQIGIQVSRDVHAVLAQSSPQCFGSKAILIVATVTPHINPTSIRTMQAPSVFT